MIQNSQLTNAPGTRSIGNAFINMRGREICYIIKQAPGLISGYRLNPHNEAEIVEFILQTYNRWTNDEWVMLLRKADALHIYSESELAYIKETHGAHFDSGMFRVVSNDEMQALEGNPYNLGKALGQGKL